MNLEVVFCDSISPCTPLLRNGGPFHGIIVVGCEVACYFRSTIIVFGVLAQLVERVVRNDEARSSNLLHSTRIFFRRRIYGKAEE